MHKKNNINILICFNCGKNFIRKKKIELNKNYFCSKKCSSDKRSLIPDSELKNITVLEFYRIYKIKNRISGFSRIRNLNRKWNKHLLNNGCTVCGYKIHVELAHIKPLKDFDLKSKLCDINDESNNLALCPNHHWEFDNGLLELNNFF